MPNSDDVVVYTSPPLASADRLAGWIANDMVALAKLVDEAPDAALADRRVSAALDDLTGSLEAAKRATHRPPVDRTQPPHRPAGGTSSPEVTPSTAPQPAARSAKSINRHADRAI